MESTEHYGKILLYVKQIGPAREFNRQQLDELIKIKHRIDGTTEESSTSDIDISNLSDYQIEELIKAVTQKVLDKL